MTSLRIRRLLRRNFRRLRRRLELLLPEIYKSIITLAYQFISSQHLGFNLRVWHNTASYLVSNLTMSLDGFFFVFLSGIERWHLHL